MDIEPPARGGNYKRHPTPDGFLRKVVSSRPANRFRGANPFLWLAFAKARAAALLKGMVEV
jgi:hypothetical protein